MGCDIHLHVQYKWANDNYWYDFGKEINPGRVYGLFSTLAKGVRGENEHSFELRGLPQDLQGKWFGNNLLLISNSGEEGTATLEQATRWGVKIINNESGNPEYCEDPVWHSHSWLTLEEFRQALAYSEECYEGDYIEYHALLAAMNMLEAGENDVRVVFWFDN